MKFFSALRDAEFAREAFKSAGLDFDALRDAKNNDCVKALKSPANAGELTEAQSAIEAARSENTDLTAQLTTANGFKTKFESLSTAVESVGLKIEDPSKIKAQHDALITKAKRDGAVTAQGHAGIADDPITDPTKHKQVKKEAVDPEGKPLTGRERIRHGLGQDESLLKLVRRSRN